MSLEHKPGAKHRERCAKWPLQDRVLPSPSDIKSTSGFFILKKKIKNYCHQRGELGQPFSWEPPASSALWIENVRCSASEGIQVTQQVPLPIAHGVPNSGRRWHCCHLSNEPVQGVCGGGFSPGHGSPHLPHESCWSTSCRR